MLFCVRLLPFLLLVGCHSLNVGVCLPIPPRPVVASQVLAITTSIEGFTVPPGSRSATIRVSGSVNYRGDGGTPGPNAGLRLIDGVYRCVGPIEDILFTLPAGVPSATVSVEYGP